jgi:hypothetical protein
MSAFHIAFSRRETPWGLVPDVPGIEAVRWRWIAVAPWWFFEVQADPTGQAGLTCPSAPETYPNGVRLDSPCINEWHEPAEQEG